MRFIADGPSIPDELLLARDQGRVIFFCGAGVSRARASLPDFLGLARSVIAKLGVDNDSPACRLISEASEIDRRVGISGVISADRVFGLLERDFAPRDIQEAVASALKPPSHCDLTAHNILLDLATTREGLVQLVTTNFDRLFDDCGRGLQTWQPPKLPDPLRPNDINGIVYLHGRAMPDYSGAEGDGFVLSSSEFGRAYLADGWATSFIRQILSKYVVVFIGYTADDPPVQYLLEALRKASGTVTNAYAFQSGDHDDAIGRWRHKGVAAIPYVVRNGHAALWDSLEAWSQRARDSDAWYANVIAFAKKGPIALLAHERGQVAHVVSTYDGAKKFCADDDPPPAEWLCVFDKYRRFQKPGRPYLSDRQGPYVDPFELFGLDFDISPSRLDPEDVYAKREPPIDAWDAFEFNRLDRLAVRDENQSALRGYWASHSPRLIPRVSQLGSWLAKVCEQPAAVWWAAHQLTLHQNVREQISWELDRSGKTIHSRIRQAWRSLFETWDNGGDEPHRDWYALQTVIKVEGWHPALIRRLKEILRPRLSAERNLWGGPTPPLLDAEVDSPLLSVDVKYAEVREKLVVPDEWCAHLIEALRENLQLALTLENEIGGYGLHNISPLIRDATKTDESFHRTHGLSAEVIRFAELFSQLLLTDRLAAKREFSSWRLDDDTIFARLRIWASKNPGITSQAEFGSFIDSLSDAAFWDNHHQRDLLLVIRERWLKLGANSRRRIESRLLKGPKKWKREKKIDFERRRDWSILSRVHWLANSGCKLNTSSIKRIATLQTSLPDWKDEYAEKAVDSLESRGGWVKTNTSHDKLLELPLSLILQRAKELSGRSTDFLVENDPFAGLVAQRPARAFASLIAAAKQNELPEWAWRSFLNSESRKKDNARNTRAIGERLLRFKNDDFATIVRPASDWLYHASVGMEPKCIAIFDRLVRKFIDVLQEFPNYAGSGIVRGSREPDWTMEAINSPAGKVAEALFHDSRWKIAKQGEGFPESWLNQINALLSLSDGLRQQVLVILFHNLNWFYWIESGWTEKNLLPLFHSSENEDDRDAAWSGFLWGARTPNRELYARLKDDMLAFAVDPLPSRRSFSEIIAGMILAGWGTFDEADERCVSDDEMRTLLLKVDDDFRSRILWQAQNWSGEQSADTGERWSKQLPELLRIWPRQITTKSPNTSARLCELAFSSGEQFPTIVSLALPLITKIERDHLMLPELHRSGKSIIDKYPDDALALLYAALPDNAMTWPYGIEGVLQRIREANGTLNLDERLIDLQRRWDAR